MIANSCILQLALAYLSIPTITEINKIQFAFRMHEDMLNECTFIIIDDCIINEFQILIFPPGNYLKYDLI